MAFLLAIPFLDLVSLIEQDPFSGHPRIRPITIQTAANKAKRSLETGICSYYIRNWILGRDLSLCPKCKYISDYHHVF